MTPNDWRERAACRDDPEAMFPDTTDHHGIHAAKKVCRDCPVAERCFRWAVEKREPYGVWGGFTESERERIRAGRQVLRCSTCRTTFVPRFETQHRCGRCAVIADYRHATPAPPDQPRKNKLDPHRTQVEVWVAAGVTYKEIGREFGVAGDTVRKSLKRWADSSTVLLARENRRIAAVDHTAIQLAEAGLCGIRELNLVTQVELFRLHLRRGGTPTDFSCRYHTSGTKVKQLRELAETSAVGLAA